MFNKFMLSDDDDEDYDDDTSAAPAPAATVGRCRLNR
jgi:hypothetical protein